LCSEGFDESKKEMACDGGSSSQGLIVIGGFHVDALVAAAVNKAKDHGW
jgi:hypothetical protein